MKPLIGLTTHAFLRERGLYDSLNRGYSQSVEAAGGLPVLLPVGTSLEILEKLDGLVFTGGSDVGPHHYGEEPHPALGPVDSARDEWELALVRAVFALPRRTEKTLPVLAICRGHQLVNVALGGTLWQDLPSQRPGGLGHSQAGLPMDELHHRLEVAADTRLSSVLAPGDRVNSFHHQGIQHLAPGLRESARALDGLNEAYEEDPEGPLAGHWLTSVQFHPETLTARYPAFLGLFRRLVEASVRAGS